MPARDELEPLGEEIADYLDAFRRAEQPSPQRRDRTWQAISAQVDAPAKPRWIAAAVVAIAAAALLWIALGERDIEALPTPDDSALAPMQAQDSAPAAGELRPAVAPHRSSTETRDESTAPVPELPPSPEPTQDSSSSMERASEADRQVTKPRRHPSRRPADAGPSTASPEPPDDSLEPDAPATPQASSLAAQTAAFKDIQRALNERRFDDALGQIDRYRQEFPSGAFADEMVVARARALCGAGKRSRARAVAEAFIERSPSSHLVPRLETICAD